MKTLSFILLLSLSFSTWAQVFRVVERSENNKQVFKKVKLEDLESSDSFDGRYFKIVLGKSDEALPFDANEDLVLKAATTYHHLTFARNYFVNKLSSDYVESLEKIVVRLELTNQFSELGHFAHDNYEPQFNNALTIPAGKGLASRNIQPWGKEIWFRPSKKVHLSSLDIKNQEHEFEGILRRFREQVHMQTFQRFLSQLILTWTTDNYVLDTESALRTVGATLFLELAYRSQDTVNYVFTRKWYWLDSALVPEIIYHEYAHVALSDYLELTHSTPIIEGMADYFAGKIASSPTLAKKIKKYNTFNGKDALKKTEYRMQFETNEWANTDFVFGLLWQVGEVVGKNQEAFMYELREEITTDSTIRGQLVEGLLTTCRRSCDEPFNKRIQILKLLNNKKL
ncbi:MAG: hypothetical protein WCY48_01575 [Candidatus Caldatribacteriota bacterium]